MDKVKECHVRHQKVHICKCSRCGGNGMIRVGITVTVCPECLGNGYCKEVVEDETGKNNI